jgi:hypothetical protein
MLVPRGTPFTYARHFVCICVNASVIYYMAKAIHFLGIEIKFALLKIELHLAQLIKYEPKMFLVLFDRVTKYKSIVKIYMYKSPDKISEDHCH